MALVLNCGSSSVKYGLFDAQANGDLEEVCSGLVDKIGLEGCILKHEFNNQTKKLPCQLKDHAEALQKVAEILTAIDGPVKDRSDIKVVGHRVVHGGPTINQPTVIDATSEAIIEKCVPLAPLHNPANLMGIRQARAQFPVPQVGVFDTAFHATMPPESYRYALPKEMYEKYDVRRYGFHGTSYKYVSGAAAAMIGQKLEESNMIICHIGNGCSMACLKDGKVVDTTMGLTPLEGLMMGTRCGDIDAGVYTYLCEHVKMTPKEVDTAMNKKSGLLGIGGTQDMREIIENGGKGNADAALARKMYVERVRKYLGSFLVKLNGQLDALVFTAGVGENDKGFRELVTDGLQQLGIQVDPVKNKALSGGGEIQSSLSRAKVLVVPTQEELCIAQQSLEKLNLIQPVAPKAPTGKRATSLKTGRRFSLTPDVDAKSVDTNAPLVFVIGALAIAGLAVIMDKRK